MKRANAFLPFLQQRLIRQFIVQTMTVHTGADPTLVESLLTDDRLLAGPKSLLEAFTDTGNRGITATSLIRLTELECVIADQSQHYRCGHGTER